MELKSGYRLTEVGVIPDDWHIVSIGSLGSFSKGRGICKEDISTGEILGVRYGEIYTHHNEIIRSYFTRISERVSRNSKKLRKGDLLFAGSGETKEEIGKCVAFISDEEAYAGGDIVILSPTKDDSRYLGYLLNVPIVSRQKASKGQGDAIVHISSTALSSILIPLPPTKAEQCEIAIALGEADTLINALIWLIAKKRDLKQAAMQQLLSGQIRLPGFSGKWDIKAFDKIVFLRKERIDPRNRSIGGLYVEMENIEEATGKLRGITRVNEGTSIKSVFREGDVLFGKLRAYLKKYWLADRPGVCSTEIWVFAPNVSVITSLFLFQVIKSSKFIEAASSTYGTHMPRSDWTVLKSYEIQLPPLDEQKTIAKILSDMDTEIETLEARLAKLRNLKQGMMQELLTGRIRLI